MPHFDHTGPFGEGSQTGKKLGFCSSNVKEGQLAYRFRQHSKGCKSKRNFNKPEFGFSQNEIVSVKRCRKGRHQH